MNLEFGQKLIIFSILFCDWVFYNISSKTGRSPGKPTSSYWHFKVSQQQKHTIYLKDIKEELLTGYKCSLEIWGTFELKITGSIIWLWSGSTTTVPFDFEGTVVWLGGCITTTDLLSGGTLTLIEFLDRSPESSPLWTTDKSKRHGLSKFSRKIMLLLLTRLYFICRNFPDTVWARAIKARVRLKHKMKKIFD